MAADCALFVIAANEGVDEPTKSLWQDVARHARAVVITKLTTPGRTTGKRADCAQDAFGDKVYVLPAVR